MWSITSHMNAPAVKIQKGASLKRSTDVVVRHSSGVPITSPAMRLEMDGCLVSPAKNAGMNPQRLITTITAGR